MRYPKFLALLPVLIPVLLLYVAPNVATAAVEVSFSVSVPPPVLPVYEQPPLPEPGYLWSPGYWAWDGMDYYWVPGTWVQPPVADMLWTPGYWGWRDGFYGWNPGYWGPQVGFYGGVNYGYGYTGVGYQGGYWHGGAFFYNRAVANFGQVNIVNVYNAPVQIRETSRVSFNGGQGGLRWQPNAAERVAMNEHHTAPTPMQRQHEQRAAAMPAMHVSQNGGRPQVLTTQRAADFAHPGPGLHNRPKPGPVAHATPRAEGEQPHFAGPGPAMRGPGAAARAPAPEREEAAPRPEVQGSPRPEAQGGPRPQASGAPETHGGPPHEEGRHEAAPKHEQAPKREPEPKHES